MGDDYFRRDQKDEITPPNLGDESNFVEHIVHARGRRTRFTSLSTDPKSIVIFGPQLWRFKEALAAANSHRVLSHQALLTALRNELNSHDAKAQDLAARALRRARMRKEALVLWGFNVSRVDRKDLSEWARPHVQQYFSRV